MARTFLLLALFALYPSATNQDGRDSVQTSKLELVMTAERNTITVGEAIPVQVRIINRGLYPQWVGKRLGSQTDAPSRLDILVRNADGEEDLGVVVTVGMGPFVRKNWWIELHHGYFIGLETKVVPQSYPMIRKPGVFRIWARYVSKGGKVEGAPSAEESVWEGELQSNTLQITVVPPRSK